VVHSESVCIAVSLAQVTYTVGCWCSGFCYRYQVQFFDFWRLVLEATATATTTASVDRLCHRLRGNDDQQSQWENGDFDTLQILNPWKFYYKIVWLINVQSFCTYSTAAECHHAHNCFLRRNYTIQGWHLHLHKSVVWSDGASLTLKTWLRQQLRL